MEKKETQKANVAKAAKTDLSKPLSLLWHNTRKQMQLLQIMQSSLTTKSCELETEEYSEIYQQMEQRAQRCVADTDKRIIELKKNWQENNTGSNKEDDEVLACNINNFSARSQTEE